MAARFLIEEDEEQMKRELKEAFRFYDKEGKKKNPSVESITTLQSQWRDLGISTFYVSQGTRTAKKMLLPNNPAIILKPS